MTRWWLRGSTDNKIHPGAYIDAHVHALADGASGPRRRADIVTIYGPPAVIAGVALVWRWAISPAAAALVSVPLGLMAAYLVQFTFQMFDRASAWAESRPEPGAATSEHTTLLEQLNAHGAYAALISIAAAVSAVMAGIHQRVDWTEHILVAIAYALSLHLVLLLLLVVRRVYLYSFQRLRRARTGADRTNH